MPKPRGRNDANAGARHGHAAALRASAKRSPTAAARTMVVYRRARRPLKEGHVSRRRKRNDGRYGLHRMKREFWKGLRRHRREVLMRELDGGKNIFLEALIADILPMVGSREKAKELIAMGLYRVTQEFRRQFKCGAHNRSTGKPCRDQALSNGRSIRLPSIDTSIATPIYLSARDSDTKLHPGGVFGRRQLRPRAGASPPAARRARPSACPS
jgi:hypothetical protein